MVDSVHTHSFLYFYGIVCNPSSFFFFYFFIHFIICALKICGTLKLCASWTYDYIIIFVFLPKTKETKKIYELLNDERTIYGYNEMEIDWIQVNVGCDAIAEYKNRCSPFAIDILIDIILGEERNLSLSNLKRSFFSAFSSLCCYFGTPFFVCIIWIREKEKFRNGFIQK